MTLVIIPARMGSTRLPGKPLLKIGDKTIIERCVGQARKAGFEPCVATDSEEIHDKLWNVFHGFSCILTGDCASGTDRVAAAAEIIDPEGKHEFVINYQGDMPFLDPEDLKAFVDCDMGDSDIATPCCKVELVEVEDDFFMRRSIVSHIGLYKYKRGALRKFAATPPSKLEECFSLEQLRDWMGYRWRLIPFPSMPIEINTQADLDRARSCLM